MARQTSNASNRPRPNTMTRTVTVIIATLLLSACTASYTYNQLDWLIPWYVDDYVDLTRTQRQSLQAQLAPRLAWHREEELEQYVALLDRIESGLDGTVDAGTVYSWADDLLAAAQRVERTMMEVALDFGPEVSDEQMREFIGTLWERQDEYEEEFLERSDAEYAEDDFEYLTDLLERFLGRLSPDQSAALRAAANDLQRFDRAWLQERRAWLQILEPLLRNRKPGWQEAVMNAYEARLRERTPAYHATLQHNLDRISEAYARALSIMSDRQRSRALAEIEDLRGTLLKLMDRPEVAMGATWNDYSWARRSRLAAE